MNGLQNRKELEGIRARMDAGNISYEQARKEAQPIIDRMNERAREVAKKHKRRHHDFTFGYLMR